MAINLDNLPQDTTLATKVIDVQSAHETARMQQGWIGYALGDLANKPGNIAFIVIALAFLLLFGLVWLANPALPIVDKLITAFFALITLALGYLFGKSH
jgi:hypothetical protein